MRISYSPRLRFIALLSFLLLAATAVSAQSTPDTDCQCRDNTGSMKNLGSVMCINITGQQYLVRCEMSQNTPFWKRLDDKSGCPAARVTNPLQKYLLES